METGVYVIENTFTGKVYVGSAVDLARRRRRHFLLLRNRVHHSIKLQRSFDRDGVAAFAFKPVLLCAKENLILYEQIVMDFHRAASVGYNILPTAGNLLGHKRGPETRAKMSAAQKGRGLGRKLSDETKAKISAGLRQSGRVYGHSEETCSKISALQRAWSPEKRSRGALASAEKRRGKPLSAAHRAMVSAANARRAPISASTRAKMSVAASAREAAKRERRAAA